MNLSVTSKISGDNLVFRLRAASPATSEERCLHIGILLDNSGSMEGERLAAVKRTLHAARSLFQTGDRITLVTFSDTAAILLREHVLSDMAATDAAYRAIDQIRALSSTNLSAGLEALYSVTTAYDAVILLTDGMVNAGVTSTAGLRAMAQSAGTTLTFNTLGYGATHNRALLRELSVQSRGTYTYVDSDEILALAMGDILSGLRAEVARGVRLRLSSGAAGWTCQEAGSAADSQEYYVGNMIPDRDYWVVFRATGGGGIGGAGVLTATVTATGQDALTVTVPTGEMLDEDVTDQVLRAEVASALMTASTQLEGGAAAPDMTRLRDLQTRLEALPARPLLMRLRAQVAELLELAARVTAPLQTASYHSALPRVGGDVRTHLMARMSSGATCLANQRGVYSMAGADDANTSFFSSPLQQTASNVVRHASQVPRVTTPVVETEDDDDDDAPAEPVVADSHASVHPSRLEPNGPLGVQQTPMDTVVADSHASVHPSRLEDID